MQKLVLPQKFWPVLNQYGLSALDKSGLFLLHYKKEEFICKEGEPLTYLFIVTEGKAKVSCSSANGKSLLLSFYLARGFLGDVELMSGSREAVTSVQAISAFTCIGIPVHSYQNQLKCSIPFLNCVSHALAQKLNRCGKNCSLNILYPLETRLCSYISLTSQNGHFAETLTVLSELLGTSYRHLLRTLNQLCTQNILKKEGSGYHVINPTLLDLKSEDYYLLEPVETM